MSETKSITITIAPEPAPEELAAIVSALTTVLGKAADLVSAPLPAESSRWARQGRLAAMRGLDRDPDATDLLPARGR